MPKRAKVTSEKVTAVPKSKDIHKQLASERTTRHAGSSHRAADPFMSGQISSGEDFELTREEETDDAQSDEPRPQVMDPLFAPSLSMRTKVTGGSNRSRQAVDVNFFFVEATVEDKGGKKVKMRVCKPCGDQYGYELLSSGRDNYMYQVKTGKSNCRRHLLKRHAEIYDKTAREKHWPYPLSTDEPDAKTTTDDLRRRALPQFSAESFIDYLIRFIVADDQSIRVVECPEFRDLCMVLRGSLQDDDIPHRGKLREGIVDKWRRWFDALKEELASVKGWISFTSDIWSSSSLCSYLAVTAHWISGGEGGGSLTLKSALIGFHQLKKRHTGRNIARNILHLLDRAGVTSKIGYFTLDNAKNNAMAMRELETLLKGRNTTFKFRRLNNRIRCFPHIINITVSHIIGSSTRVSKEYLKILEEDVNKDDEDDDEDEDKNKDKDGDDDEDEDDADEDDEDDADDEDDEDDYDYDENDDDDDEDDYADTRPKRKGRATEPIELDLSQLNANDRAWFKEIKRDPIKRARQVVRVIRSSDERKQDFQRLIRDGNSNQWFRDAESKVIKVPELEPLRDVKTRWDSTFNMIERLVVLQPAIDFFLKIDVKDELSNFKLTELDWKLLMTIGAVLEVPYKVQQAMSAESMPVLSGAVATFEIFMSTWEKLIKSDKTAKPWVKIGLKWARKYYCIMDETDAYIVTLILNPCTRFRWISKQWSEDYITLARTTMLRIMSEYRSKRPSSGTSRVAFRGPTPASPRKSSTFKQSSVFNTSNRLDFDDQLEEIFGEATASMSEGTVENEFDRYTSAMVSPRDTDILHFWEVNRSEFPTLYAIALDYLPIQASSVPCERVFSSAKDTDTVKRNRIHPTLMEVLQTLKFSIKKDRQSMSFTDGWRTVKGDMANGQGLGKDDLLVHLLTGDSQATTDTLLKIFDDDTDDDTEVEDVGN